MVNEYGSQVVDNYFPENTTIRQQKRFSILFQIHSIFIKNISFIGSCYRFVVFLIVPIHFRKHLCTRDKNFVNEFIRLVITTSVTSVNSVTIEMPEVRTKTIVPRCMTSVLFFPKKKKIYVAYDILKIYSQLDSFDLSFAILFEALMSLAVVMTRLMGLKKTSGTDRNLLDRLSSGSNSPFVCAYRTFVCMILAQSVSRFDTELNNCAQITLKPEVFFSKMIKFRCVVDPSSSLYFVTSFQSSIPPRQRTLHKHTHQTYSSNHAKLYVSLI